MKTSKYFKNMGLGTKKVAFLDIIPFFSEAAPGSNICICNDGSIVFFFQINGVNLNNFVKDVMNYLIFRSTFQVYKLRSVSETTYFGSIKLYMDYSCLKMSYKDTLRWFLWGSNSLADDINEITDAQIKEVEQLLGSRIEMLSPVRPVSGVHKFLLSSGASKEDTPMVDVSVVQVADTRQLGLFALNDLNAISGEKILDGFECLQVFSFCVPSDKYERECNTKFLRIFNLIDFLSVDDGKIIDDSEKKVTISYENKKLCFYSNTIFFAGEDIRKLTECINKAKTVFLEHGMINYMYMNTAGEQYVSCFPGRAEFGTYYLMDNRDRILHFAGRFLGL